MDVKNFRENHNITQQQLADLCGVTLRTVQNWEKGKPIPVSMQKLLNAIEDGHEIISSGEVNGKGVSVAAGKGSKVRINQDVDRFFKTLERQQDIMSRQLEELAKMREMAIKKDEQIDTLLKLIQQRQ
jgi:transcriptional regulator with XRE-family HTH domain